MGENEFWHNTCHQEYDHQELEIELPLNNCEAEDADGCELMMLTLKSANSNSAEGCGKTLGQFGWGS